MVLNSNLEKLLRRSSETRLFFSPKHFCLGVILRSWHGPKLAIPGVCYGPSATVEDAIFGYYPDWLC